jgi:hypothetical protein
VSTAVIAVRSRNSIAIRLIAITITSNPQTLNDVSSFNCLRDSFI